MRFSKRIKICKGLSLNLSKSGASLTAGKKGASVNIGSKGAYINAGIPGTGLSTRKKIGGFSRNGSKERDSIIGGKKQVMVDLTMSLDDSGRQIIKDNDGKIITDETILKQLRTQESYKEALKTLVQSRKEAIDKENSDFIEIYKQTPKLSKSKSQLAEKITNPEKFILTHVEEVLNDVVLPVEFSVDYQYYKEVKALYIDLDLPEIEDMPQKKAIVSSTGKLSIKAKGNKELKKDYARCALGLAFFFAGNFFNISNEIEEIIVSGYTQRLSKRSGNIEDEYIYSIKFNSAAFNKLNVQLIDPIEAVHNFEHAMNVTSAFELKAVKPLAVHG